MYRLVALDMDGTMLNENRKLNDRVKKALFDIRKKGVKVILTSGRGFKGIEKFVKELQLDELVISLNGATVTDATGNKLIFSEHLKPDTARKLIKIAKEYDVFNVLFIGKDMYVEEMNEKAHYFGDFEGVNLISVGNFLEFYKSQPLGKMLMIDKHEKLQMVKEQLQNNLGRLINATFSLSHFLEAYSVNVNKGIMLKKAADYYGIKREEVIAMGDGENDISMIEYAGLGVAMGNAAQEIKDKSDFITKTNIEDGVACVLEKFILNI